MKALDAIVTWLVIIAGVICWYLDIRAERKAERHGG